MTTDDVQVRLSVPVPVGDDAPPQSPQPTHSRSSSNSTGNASHGNDNEHDQEHPSKEHSQSSGKSGTATGTFSAPSTPTDTSSNKHHHSRSGSTSSSGKSPKSGSSGTTPRSSRTPRKSRRGGKKTSITFKKTVGVHTIPNIDTYSIQERDTAWYAPDEYGEMEDECDLTATLLDRKQPLRPGFCERGLEAWTTEGEQRKEGNVQLAIDIVWQAQLDQWKASSDMVECWEFIRSRYIAVSKPCHRIAHRRGLADEKEVQAYLAGVRSVEKNRLRLLGIHQKSVSKDKRVRRNSTGPATPNSKGILVSSPTTVKSGTSRKGLLKAAATGVAGLNLDADEPATNTTNAGSAAAAAKKVASSGSSVVSTGSRRSTGGASTASGRKVSYEPKSRSKVPVSPVGSLVSAADSDENSASRRMRSHLSVASDESNRRRMLRANAIKPL